MKSMNPPISRKKARNIMPEMLPFSAQGSMERLSCLGSATPSLESYAAAKPAVPCRRA